LSLKHEQVRSSDVQILRLVERRQLADLMEEFLEVLARLVLDLVRTIK
jgi:hypothetical protein